MEKTVHLYEGKAKKVFATNDENVCIVSYKDDATAFNGAKKGTIEISYYGDDELDRLYDILMSED